MNKFYNWAKGNTTKEQIVTAINEDLNVIEQIHKEMITDYDCDSMSLLVDYQMANEDERAIMDTVLINLCGWSMGSIIEQCKEDSTEDNTEDVNDKI